MGQKSVSLILKHMCAVRAKRDLQNNHNDEPG